MLAPGTYEVKVRGFESQQDYVDRQSVDENEEEVDFQFRAESQASHLPADTFEDVLILETLH